MMSQSFLIVFVNQIVRVGTGTPLYKHGYEVLYVFYVTLLHFLGAPGHFLAF